MARPRREPMAAPVAVEAPPKWCPFTNMDGRGNRWLEGGEIKLGSCLHAECQMWTGTDCGLKTRGILNG